LGGTTVSFKRFLPIALGLLAAGNIAGVYGAVAAANPDPMHATLHAVAAVGLAIWSQWAWRRRGSVPTDSQVRIEGVEADVDSMRQELLEAQERLDFAERMLAQQARDQLPRRQ
jgi:hypothetical protein